MGAPAGHNTFCALYIQLKNQKLQATLSPEQQQQLDADFTDDDITDADTDLDSLATSFPLLPDPRLGRLSATDGAPGKGGGMGLLTIIKKVKAKEREMRLLMVCVGGPSPAPPHPPAAPAPAPAGLGPRGGGGR